ncbi:hypothetical protein [Paracoccus aerodenitrificans]|uniref:hypothetical protein n=1 Tax=Paracoccus aerodenitrificans TaxID=3017781 RepID=UPI0022EFDBEE|nr:hypothetical protein [Paracoccus aerodenitrificans]WBU63238.1 hypothetical protein PAE61_12835 [Paracoccus aerodenitrificans]
MLMHPDGLKAYKCRPGHFVIIAQARSGSSFLRESLNAQPEITCHGEVLSRKWIGKLLPRPGQPAYTRSRIEELLPLRDADTLNFLDQYVLTSPDEITGFKIIYEDLLLTGLADRLECLVRSRGMTVFHLRRRNHLAAYLSRLRMAKHGVSHSTVPETQENRAPGRKLHIEPGKLSSFIETQTNYATTIDRIFPDSVQLSYETLQRDFPGILNRLGLPPAREFSSDLRKLAPTSLRDIIENYDDVAAYDSHEQPVWT